MFWLKVKAQVFAAEGMTGRGVEEEEGGGRETEARRTRRQWNGQFYASSWLSCPTQLFNPT